MKILQVIASVDPRGGGPVESLKQVGIVLQEELGHTVEVVSLDDPDESFVSDFPLKLYPLGPGRSFYSYSSKLVPWLQANHEDYDCVIVRGIWRYNSYGVWRALRKCNTPYFVFTHGMLDPWFRKNYPLKHLKKYLYWRWGEYRVLRDAKAVLFTSEEEKVLARESFAPYTCNEEVVAYGTNKPEGDTNKLGEVFLERFPEAKDKRIVLFLGRIHEKKGCDLLINAFEKVAHEDDDLHLVIAGPDQVGLRAQLVKLAKNLGIDNRITWTGMIEGDLKWGALSAAEVFILPSHQENFGIVVAEALACETPVLITDKVNIWREIEKSGAGFVEEDSVEGITKLLRRWLSLSDEERNTMSKYAAKCYTTHFSVKEAAQSLIQVIADNKRH